MLIPPGARTQGLLTAQALTRDGVGRTARTRAVAAGTLVRVRPAVYAAGPLPALPRFVVTEAGVAPAYVLQVRAALLSLGAGATACGRTAAVLRGWGLLVEPRRTLDLAVPHGRSRARAAGVTLTQRRGLARQQVTVLPGTEPLWITSAVRTVIDCCLSLPLLEAVVICDSALRSGQVTLRALQDAAGRQAGVRQARRVYHVLGLADPRSGSVLESVLRCRLVLAGMSGFVTQREIRDLDGRHVLRVDFCFERCRLVVEVDGARWHQDAQRDQRRDNALASLGYRVLRYSWGDVMHEPVRILAEVRAAVLGGSQGFHLVAGGSAAAA